MKKTLMLLGLVILLTCSYAQNYITRTAHINVKSANKVQNIVADNYQAACQLNAQTGQLKIIALIKSFEYQIGAMNRVMNTRDMDVSDYPKITFDGKIEKINQLNLTVPGSYPVHMKGLFYVWDENAPAEVDGFLTIKTDGSLELKTNFTVAVERLDVKKIDMIMRQKLPVSLNLPSNTLGISKNVQINALAILKKQ